MDAKSLEVLKQLKGQMAARTEKPDAKSKAIDPEALLRLLTDVNLILHGEPSDAKRSRSKKKSKQPKATACQRKPTPDEPARTKPKSPWPANETFRNGADRRLPSNPAVPVAARSANAPQRTSRAKGGRCVFRGVSVSQAQYKALKESMALMIYGNDHRILTKKFDALKFYLANAKDDQEAVGIYEKISKMLISGKTTKSESAIERERRIAIIRADVAKVANSIKATQKIADKEAPEWSKRYCHVCRAEFFIHRDWVKPPTRCKKCRDSYYDAITAKSSKNRKSGKTVYSHYVIYSGGSPGLGKRH
jgi:hypothetical protein